MELKKSPKADLQNKKGLFLEIGLVVSLLLTIGVFSWSQSEKVVDKFDMGIAKVEEEIVEITRQDQKPPEPVKQTVTVISDIINVVKNDTKIQTTIDFSDFNEDIAIAAPKKVVEEKVDEEVPIMIAEEMPTFQGGGDLNAFRTWVQSRLKYPIIAAENGVQGRVTLEFVIEKDGTLGRVKVLAGPDKSLSDESIRIVSSSPKWTAGKQRGRAVPVKFILPVDFRLE